MNICIITSSFPSNSHDVVQAPFLVDFINGLKKRGHQVFVFTQDRIGEKEEFLKDVKVKWFSWIKSKKPLVQLNLFNPLDFLRIVNLFYSGKKQLLPFVKENKIEACLALWVLPADDDPLLGLVSGFGYLPIREKSLTLFHHEEDYSGSQRRFCGWL